MIASSVANFSGNLKKGARGVTPADVFPWLGGPTPQAETVEDQIRGGFAAFKIVRPVDIEAARKAAARPPKRKKR